MSKYFLYIDESKDYKNNTLYLGGIVTPLGFHTFEKYCTSKLPLDFPFELKSTRPKDREFLCACSNEILCPFKIFVRKLPATNDLDYINALMTLIGSFLTESTVPISALDISADFIRLDSDMRRFQRSISKKFSNQFGIPINIEFKNSSQYRSIQFADLAVGIYRRE